jgi:hypothetical protein
METRQDVSVKEENVRIARQSIEAFNTGDISKVHKFIGPEYFNHELHTSASLLHFYFII